MKLAVIGGGSRFVANIAHGLELTLPEESPGRYEVALFDVEPQRAQQMANYGRAVAQRRQTPVDFNVYKDRNGALANASHVLVCVGLPEAEAASRRAIEKYGYPPHSIHDGPTSLATALEAAPLFLEIATAIKLVCPAAVMVNLVNPTDVLADLVQRAVGVSAVGLCVEVPLWLECLAYYLDVPLDDMWAVHGGINHEGWITQLRIGGPTGRVVGREEILALAGHPSMHILNRGALMVYELTGMLPSSGGHYWQFSDYDLPGAREFWEITYRQRRQAPEERARRALAECQPLDRVRSGHPISDAPLSFMGVGMALARWMLAVETAQPARLALQVPNDGGFISNWPRNVFVEVPAEVESLKIIPQTVGELPEVPCSLTKLAAWQRKRMTDFILDGRLQTARHALAATAHLTGVHHHLAFAEELFARRAELDRSLRPFIGR